MSGGNWFKLDSSGLDPLIRGGEMTKDDIAFYVYIMGYVKVQKSLWSQIPTVSRQTLDKVGQTADIRVPLSLVKPLGTELKVRRPMESLARLVHVGWFAELTDTELVIDWRPQLSEREAVTSKNTRPEIQKLCATGDHSKCYRPFCTEVKRYARGHGPSCLTTGCKLCKRLTQEVSSDRSENGQTTGHRVETETLSPEGKEEKSKERQNLPSPAPGGAAPSEPARVDPSEAGAPVDDAEPLRPRTPLAEIELDNFDLHDVIGRTEVVAYEYDDGDQDLNANLILTNEFCALYDDDAERFRQILDRLVVRVGWIQNAIARQLPGRRIEYTSVASEIEDRAVIEVLAVTDRDRTVEIVEDALREAGLSPVARE